MLSNYKITIVVGLSLLHFSMISAFKKTSFMSLQHKLKKTFSSFLHPEHRLRNKLSIADRCAQVVQNSIISAQEEFVIQQRLTQHQAAFEQLFNDQQLSELPRIGIIASGGGYRAMILTLGYLMGFHEIGLLDICSYISALSGSTWFVGPWISSGLSISDYKSYLLKRIAEKKFSLKDAARHIKLTTLVNDILWPKFVFKQPISSVDIYGALLAQALMPQYLAKYQLSDQITQLQDGKYPFPIYTAVARNVTSFTPLYDWYEFNPLEVHNLSLHLAIPSFAFDWRFSQGSSCKSAPEQHFSYLMGIFGSAYSVNIKEAFTILYDRLQKHHDDIHPIDQEYYRSIFSLMKRLHTIPGLNIFRVSQARVNNPFKDFQPTQLKSLASHNYITLLDGGVDYNLAGLPLFRPERNINACIILDSSNQLVMNQSLRKLFADIKRLYGYEYTRADDKSIMSLRLYRDLKHQHAPAIIYLNYLPDNNLLLQAQQDENLYALVKYHHLDSFNAFSCADTGYGRTVNFDYTQEQFLQLSAMAELVVKVHKDKIIEFLRETLTK